MKSRRHLICWFALLLAGCSTVAFEPSGEKGARTAETACEFTREPEPEGLSGISRIAGDRYYCVDDRGGLLHEVEISIGDDGDVKGFAVLRSVKLEGRQDLEGCAVDPLDGRVWVSDEKDTSVRQFDPQTGKETARVEIPAVFSRHVVRNRSFEALAISPDGYRMYVANEDTLACDGAVADRDHGGVIRIQEFVRTGKGCPWSPARQFRYRTEPVEGDEFKGVAISGVAALCAPGDGSLLVLEREMSQKTPLFPSFHARLYEISLDGEGDCPPKHVVWDENTMFANYEGICLGPMLKDGSRALVLVSDGGGEADESVLILSLR